MATPLIKWYLEHGLEVTHVYQVVEYTPVPCFQPFGEAVSDARRAGDVDPNKAIIADTMKLVIILSSAQIVCIFISFASHIYAFVFFFSRWETPVTEKL